MQRLAWRIETRLFKRKCDRSWKDIISTFPPDIPFKIYDENIWNSDIWNAKDYWQDFDFSKPFFEQFYELLKKVPLPSRGTIKWENSDFCNNCWFLKNCYLTFCSSHCENTHYSIDAISSDYCVDCFGIIQSENCYESLATIKCYNVEHCYDVKNCSDSKFLLSCDWCSNCYWCFNLNNAKYHIFNESYSKEKYFEKYNEIISKSLFEQKKQFEEFHTWKYIKTPLPNTWSENILNCEDVLDSQNISYSRHIFGAQNMRYSQRIQSPKSNLIMDHTWYGYNTEKIYFCQQVWTNANNIFFCHSCFNELFNLYYSMYCRNNVSNCFGCISLNNSKYCILNKQYSKEDYEKLVPKIIEHMMKTWEWWEYFPVKYSHNWYNDSICQVLKPLTKEEALIQWFKWSDYENPFPKVEKIIPAYKLPDNIKDIPDDILNWAIECEVTKKPFRIIKPELDFYRKHNLPIPKRHPDQRYIDRLKWYVNY
jgi:hypothetical protein